MSLPQMLTVRQHFPDHQLHDIADAVQKQMDASQFAARIKPGARIAITAGSRGIKNIPLITRSVVDYFKNCGAKPFIFPAMGSHGDATAEGQIKVLERLGVTEAAMGCSIVSSMDVVSMGRTPDGVDVEMDKNAYESDGVFVINRVKWHTDFTGTIESGLFKMMAIGVGKHIGADRYHRLGADPTRGMEKVIRSVGHQLLASGKILGGFAILEDANNNTAQVVAMPAEGMERKEEELLALVKSWKGDIPVPELDILIVDEIGKQISGPGMDTKVINRSITTGMYNPLKNTPTPWIGHIYARSLRPDREGKAKANGMGIGMADVAHDRLVAAVDWEATRKNAETAHLSLAMRTPPHYSTDRECLERIAKMSFVQDPSDIRIGWIRNSLELNALRLSENLRAEIEANPRLEIIGEAEPFVFDAEGQLPSRPFLSVGSKTALVPR